MNKLQGYIAGIILILALSACKDEPIEPTTPPPNCNCDRYIEHTIYYLPGGSQFGDWITINDCTGIQTNGSWNSNYQEEPVNGECK